MYITFHIFAVYYRFEYSIEPLREAVLVFTLTLSQTTVFRPFETGRAADDNFKFNKNGKVLHTGRKHCEKRRNCSLRAIFAFPTVFSKYLYCRHVKTKACLGKG